jgi:hypothetical protein
MVGVSWAVLVATVVLPVLAVLPLATGRLPFFSQTLVLLSYLCVVAAPAALATFVVVFAYWLRRRWRETGLPICRGCGYDLTGNVSGVCPECGAPGE